MGRRLNELRRTRGYTLGELEARLTGVGRPILLSALSKIEKGQRRVDVDDLVALARVLDVSPNSLLLPSHTAIDAEVELTSSTTLDAGTAWRWATQDRPPTRGGRGIFISYASADAAWASWIAWQLANAGHEVMIDSWDLRPGSDIRSYITDSITRAACVIAVVSRNYEQSSWGKGELNLAMGMEGLPVIPVIISGFGPLDGPLADRQWIRIDKSAEDQARLCLLEAVERRGILPRPSTGSPPFPPADSPEQKSLPELMSGLSDGEPAALVEIIRRYSDLVFAKVRSFRLQDADALDAVQMTWLRLAENAHRIHIPEQLGGWLATTASRECLQILRDRTRETLTPTHLTEDNIPDPAPNPEQHAIDADIARTLWDLVAELPPHRRSLLRALFSDNPRAYSELARAAGIPAGGIGPTRARALQQLRRRLAEHGLGTDDADGG